MLAVALGPRGRVASLEAAAIASGGCRGNTASARGTGLMPRRHRTQAGRARTRQPGHRRAGLPDALKATAHWLPTADGKRRRSDDREPRREAGRLMDRLRVLPYAEQYAAWQRARWHLGLGESPVDVLGTRGDTPGCLVRWHWSIMLRASPAACSVLRGMASSPSGPATRYRVRAMPTASVEPWTASADCCACGASRPEVPKSSSGPGWPPDVLRPQPWRMSDPVSRGRAGGVAGSGTV